MRSWHIGLVFFVLALAMLACGSSGELTSTVPPLDSSGSALPRATLEPKVSEVWHAVKDDSERRVEQVKSAGVGDRVRTDTAGKALLKWVDLVVQLYYDTRMHIDDCGAANTCLGMEMGTAVSGGVHKPDRHVRYTTDLASVELVGTTVMISYHPGTRRTIVRVFDGQALVRNLTGSVQQTETVSAGQWAVVEPDTPPRASEQYDELRRLARELGLWDTFHEVELDVQQGFGPRPVPPAQVALILVTATPGLSRTPVPESATPPVPTPVTTPVPECRVAIDALNIRQGPDAGSPTVRGALQTGARINPLTRSSDGSWLYVQVLETGETGWVSARQDLFACTGMDISKLAVATAPTVPTHATPTQPPTRTPSRVATIRPELITDFEAWGTWTRGNEAWGTFTQSQEQVYAGSYSGKFIYNFPAVSNNYLVFRQVIPIDRQPSALRIMVYGDGSGNFLNAWVQDANDQLWQFTFGQIRHTGWQEIVAPLDLGRGWPNQATGGGPKTASPVYPLRFYALVLDGYREDIPLQGTIYVDELFASNAPPPTTPTSQFTPIPTASVSFRSDRTTLYAGECTTLRWDVDNVRDVFLDGQGVTGHESRQICPTATQTYRLIITHPDGSQKQVSVTIQVTGGGGSQTPPPGTTQPPVGPCQAIPGESYGALDVEGSRADRPAETHGDLNLALRGYQSNSAARSFVDFGPAADPNGPQLPGLFGDRRTPTFTSTYRVNDWNWSCNCRGSQLTNWEVTLLGMGVGPGESIYVPDAGYAIGSGYKVLVLYASPDRITLKYTPEDNVVRGYTVHVEGVCVEPNLLGLYRALDGSGRGRLPALRAGQAFGRAKGGEILVAVRDGGVFFDPRSRQDWWRGR